MYPQYIWIHPCCLIYNWMDASTIHIWIHPCCLIYNRMDVSTVHMDISTLLNLQHNGCNHNTWIQPCITKISLMDTSMLSIYGCIHIHGCIQLSEIWKYPFIRYTI